MPDTTQGLAIVGPGLIGTSVALAAKRRGIPAVVVMPQTTPNIKVSAVRALGGEVVLHGDDYDSAYEHAQTIVRERNLAFVHPFDDPDVIAGQGTIGMEILRQHALVQKLERQVRFTAGSLVLTGVVLAVLIHPYFVWLSAFIGAGLVFAAVTDTCAMGMLLAKMPWNKPTARASCACGCEAAVKNAPTGFQIRETSQS